MTDLEMAVRIGEKTVELEVRIVALKAILMNMKTEDGQRVDWIPMLAEAESSPPLSQSAQGRFEQLHALLSPSTPEAEVIHRLHESVFYPLL
jgi:hypothetical protein